jgi:prefoldin alpha subunit
MDEKQGQEMERLRYIYNVYMQEYESLLSTISGYTSASNAITRNIEVMEKLDTIEKKDLLLDLEGGVFIEVKSKQVSNVLTYVGAGYVIEKNKDDALEFLNKNIKRSKEIIDKFNLQKQKLENELLDTEYKLSILEQG